MLPTDRMRRSGLRAVRFRAVWQDAVRALLFAVLALSAAAAAGAAPAEPSPVAEPSPAPSTTLAPTFVEAFERDAARARTELLRPQADFSYEHRNWMDELRGRLAEHRDRAAMFADRGTLETRLLDAQIARLSPPPG